MRWFALLIFACLANPCTAQSKLSKLDDVRNWGAVGRLNIDGGGFCTATLISETQVLTAGHCLYDLDTGALIDPSRMEFRAGWKHGRAEAYRKIERAVAHPEFSFAANAGLDRVAHDIAVLELVRPIRNPQIIPFPVAEIPSNGAEIGVVSYAHDRAETPSLQEVCHILAEQKGAYVMSCIVDFGSSGAPVFRFDLGVPAIVSVVSAKAKMGTDPISLGARARDQVWVIEDVIAGGDVQTTPTITAQTGTARQGLGAKFVKP